jgi:hypothetical protein
MTSKGSHDLNRRRSDRDGDSLDSKEGEAVRAAGRGHRPASTLPMVTTRLGEAGNVRERCLRGARGPQKP